MLAELFRVQLLTTDLILFVSQTICFLPLISVLKFSSDSYCVRRKKTNDHFQYCIRRKKTRKKQFVTQKQDVSCMCFLDERQAFYMINSIISHHFHIVFLGLLPHLLPSNSIISLISNLHITSHTVFSVLC